MCGKNITGFFPIQLTGTAKHMKSKLLPFILTFVFFSNCAVSHGGEFEQNLLLLPDDLLARDLEKKEDDFIDKDLLRNSILWGAGPITFIFGAKAWDWDSDEDFKSEEEGWFGDDTALGGADKIGHFYAHYLMQRIFYNIFDYTEDGHKRKWLYSLGVTLGVGTLIEVGDGFSSSYGFSYEDLVMDIGGVLFGALLDYSPVMDAFLGMSVYYWPSEGYRDHRDTVPIDFVSDYSGFKYMFNFKLAGFEEIGYDVPTFLRYLQLDLGYYTRGFSKSYDFNTKDFANPTRNWFFGVSLNVAEIIRDLFDDPSSLKATIASEPFEYYHLPLGLEYDEEI